MASHTARSKVYCMPYILLCSHSCARNATYCCLMKVLLMMQHATCFMPPPLQGESDKSKKERFVLSVVYSHDYSLVASGAMDGTVAVYDVASGKLLHSLKGHYKPVRSLTFTPGKTGYRSTMFPVLETN